MYYDPSSCGKRIRKLRKLSGYTQEALAERLNSSQSHLAKIESGKEGPSIDLLVEMASVFHTSLDYLAIGMTPERDILKHKIHAMIEFLRAIDKEL